MNVQQGGAILARKRGRCVVHVVTRAREVIGKMQKATTARQYVLDCLEREGRR